jgi:hypothetical protein
MAHVVEQQPRRDEALSSNPSIAREGLRDSLWKRSLGGREQL